MSANLIAHLGDPRFDSRTIHHEIEALDRAGLTVSREHRAPDALLAWIDAEFGGAWSSEVARSGAYYARDADGFAGFAAYDARMFDYRWLAPYARENDLGIFGPIGVAQRSRKRGLGELLTRAAMFGLRERGYRRAVIGAVGTPQLVAWYERNTGARVADEFDPTPRDRRWRTTVLASGNGSNFAAVVEAAAAGTLPLEIAALVCNRADALVLERAARADIRSRVVVWDRADESRADFDARVLVEVAATEPELVLLLGWMHVLPQRFVETFAALNIHPAYLPFDPAADHVTLPDATTIPVFRGPRVVDDALAAGVRWIGASMHRVSPDVDRGGVLARLPVPIHEGEERSALDERLHAAERAVVAAGIRRWTWEQP